MWGKGVFLGGLFTGVMVFSVGSFAGPAVEVTFRNLGSEEAIYTVVTSNEATTRLNAQPKPREHVPGQAMDAYSVQSKTSPDANAAVVRYVIGRKTCEFSTTYVLGVGSGGVRVPKWNKAATPSGGAVCTANITSFNATTREWKTEFTMR